MSYVRRERSLYADGIACNGKVCRSKNFICNDLNTCHVGAMIDVTYRSVRVRRISATRRKITTVSWLVLPVTSQQGATW